MVNLDDQLNDQQNSNKIETAVRGRNLFEIFCDSSPSFVPVNFLHFSAKSFLYFMSTLSHTTTNYCYYPQVVIDQVIRKEINKLRVIESDKPRTQGKLFLCTMKSLKLIFQKKRKKFNSMRRKATYGWNSFRHIINLSMQHKYKLVTVTHTRRRRILTKIRQ